MKNSIQIILSIILFLIINNLSAQTESFGQRCIKFEQYEKAKLFYKNNVRSGQTLFYLGEAHFKSGSIDSANYYFNLGATLFPNDPWCYVGLAKVKIEKNSQGEIYPLINKAIANSNNKDPKISIAIARAYFETKNKDFDKAIEYLEKAKAINKTSVDVYLALGDLLLAQKKMGEAANAYQTANYYEPNNTDGIYSYGRIYALSKNLEVGTKAFNDVIAIDSLYSPAYRELANLYAEFGYYSKAHWAYNQYFSQLEPNYADHVKFATILFFDNDYKSSLNEVIIALAIDSQNLVMNRLLAYNYYETKAYSIGLSAMQNFFKIASENKIIASDYEYYGKILAKNNQDSLAIENYLKAIEKDSSKIRLYENLGTSYEKIKKYPEAIQSYNKLISSQNKPSSSDYFLLARCSYFYAGSKTDSIEKLKYLKLADTTLASVISLSPNSYLGYFWRARVNALIDPETELGLAKVWYESAIKIMETNTSKYKKDLLESYQYLGYYYYLKNEITLSKEYWTKILTIDPTNTKAIEAINGMK